MTSKLLLLATDGNVPHREAEDEVKSLKVQHQRLE